ncbi:MAG: Ig-like domain-containing protein [Candidatus Coatesbacteria bacterium]|nr:Ig-like domain-containing protein [Candidatus Coatesbacteria bacterium]
MISAQTRDELLGKRGLLRLFAIAAVVIVVSACSPDALADSAQAAQSPSILFVDDSASFFSESTASYLTEALDNLGFEYDMFSVFESATSPSVALLVSYDVVIYSIGGNSLNPLRGYAQNVMAYLDAGGAILLSAGEYAYQNTDSVLLDYMHVTCDYYTRPLLILGTPHDPIASGMSFSTESPFGNRDFFMLVKPLDDLAQVFMTMSSGTQVNGAAVRLPADGTELGYRAVFLSFALEGLVDTEGDRSARDELLLRIIHWLMDTTPPSVVHTSPLPDEQVPYTNAACSVELSDDGTGVDPDSIELRVNDEAVEFSTQELMDSIIVLYRCDGDLAPGSEMRVEIACADRSPTANPMEPYRYRFTIRPDAAPDTEPPFIEDFGPAGVVENPADPFSVLAVIADDGTGVDMASLAITVNGREVDAGVKPTDGGYMISYMGKGEFGFNKSYNIEIAGQDLAAPPNVMEPCSFSFSIGADVWPPILVSTSPPDGAVVELDELFTGTSRGISAFLRDFGGRIDADSVRMRINGAIVTPALFEMFNGAKVNYYGASARLEYGQLVRVELLATDDAPSQNPMGPVSWTFRLGQDRMPPRIQATIPVDSEQNVPRNSNLFVTVSEDVALESISSDTILVDCNPGGEWQGQIAYLPDAACIHFTPLEYFPSGATVSVTVRETLADRGGNPLQEPYQFAFRTSGQYDFEPPEATAFLRGSVGNGTIRCQWRLSLDPGLALYKVYYDSDGCCEPYEGADADQGRSPINLFRETTIDLTGLDNGKTYHIAVTAVDACANESDYTAEEFVASPEELIDAPTLNGVVAGYGSAVCKWSSPKNLFVAGYRVHYRRADGGASESQAGQDFSSLDAGASLSCTVRGLENGVHYELFVTAYDQQGQDGHASNSLTVRPTADVDWFQLQPSGPRPHACFNHQTVLDPARKRVYVLGGTADYEEEDLLYVLDLEQIRWELVPTSGPFPPFGRCLAHFDSVRDCIFVLASDMSVYQLVLPDHVWIRHEPFGEAPVFEPSRGTPLIGAGFLDAKRNRLLYYGAYLQSSWGGEFVTDFFAFDLQTYEWSTLECNGFCPSTIYLTAMAYAEAIDRAYLFGGFGEDGVTSSIFVLDLESLFWLPLPLNGTAPMQTYIHDMQYDGSLNRMIVFGGRTSDFSVANEIFSYDIGGNRWTDLAPILTGIPRSPVVRTPILIVPAGVVGPIGYMMVICGYDYEETFDEVYCLRLYDFTADTTPPARVEDLGADLTDDGTQVRLRWTAPGDDGSLGRAQGYDVRFSTTPINDDDAFQGALILPMLHFPSFPGATENLLFAPPEADRRYYFALKAFDEAMNYSELSNCAGAGPSTTPPSPYRIKNDAIRLTARNSDDVETTVENAPILR